MPNWMACGLVDKSVEALTEGAVESGAAEELHTILGLRLLWSTEARQEIHRRVPK